MIALQNSINSIIILNINNEKEMTITITKQSKQNALNSIIHFDFVYTSPMFDLVVVETSGIHFYKIDEDKIHSKEIKFIALTINYCWFEVRKKFKTNYMIIFISLKK